MFTLYYLGAHKIDDIYTLIGSIICDFIIAYLLYTTCIKEQRKKKIIQKLFDETIEETKKVKVISRSKETKKDGLIINREKKINFTHEHYIECEDEDKKIYGFYCNEHLYKFLMPGDEIDITYKDLKEKGICLLDIK